jgi:hypothetical protein
MKKLLIILLFIPLISFGQNDKTVNLNIKKERISNNRGYTYLGNGIYSISIGEVFWASKGAIIKKLLVEVKSLSNALDANYSILHNNTPKSGDYRKGVTTFELRDKNGNNLLIDKNEAKKEIIELKGFLDLGLITQEEFDKKAVFLKKVLLGN